MEVEIRNIKDSVVITISKKIDHSSFAPINHKIKSNLSNVVRINNCKTRDYWNYYRISKAIVEYLFENKATAIMSKRFQSTYFNINKWPMNGNINRVINIKLFVDKHESR